MTYSEVQINQAIAKVFNARKGAQDSTKVKKYFQTSSFDQYDKLYTWSEINEALKAMGYSLKNILRVNDKLKSMYR